jgi:protein-tyrosine phosphatase
MNPIRTWLYIGKYRDTRDDVVLMASRIGAMLLLAEPVQHEGIESLYLPVEDLAPIRPEHLAHGVAFMTEQKSLGRRILVACGAGINRSSAFATAALKEIEGLGLLEAFQSVKRYHRDALPHPPVWRSLCDYYKEDVPYSQISGGLPEWS